MTRVKTEAEIEKMRISGQMLKSVLDSLEKNLSAGMSGNDIDQLARQELKKIDGKAAFLNYYGFPGVICISINDEVVHGTPRPQKLKNGDIVGLDFGINYRGMITDSARTLAVGKVDKKVEKLLKVTEQSLFAGIDKLKDGVRVGDISEAIQKVLDKENYGIVRDLVGHGVGHDLHEEPNIPNFGTAGTGPTLKAGMTVALEPMATLGDWHLKVDDDKWTIRTADGSLAAHFEHTILITEAGSEVLT
jgi:methionyl aminopeptidase